MRTPGAVDAGTRFATSLGIVIAFAFSGLERDVGPVVLRLSDIAFVALTTLMVLRLAVVPTVPRVLIRPAAAVLFGFVAFRCLSALWLSGATDGVIELVQGAQVILVALLVGGATRTTAGRDAFLRGGLLALWAIAIYTVVYHARLGNLYNFKRLDDPKLVFGILAAVHVSQWVIAARRGRTASSTRLLAVASLALAVLAGDRKGWAAAIIAVVVVGLSDLWRRDPTERRSRRSGLALIGAAGAIALLPMAERAFPEDSYTARQLRSLTALTEVFGGDSATAASASSSNAYRLFAMEAAWEDFHNEPITGVGPGQFRERIEGRAAAAGIPPPAPHNMYLETAVETGVVGLLLLVLGAGLLLIEAMRWSRRLEDRDARAQIVGLAVYGVVLNVFMASGLLNTLILMVPLGLCLGVATEMRSQRRNLPAGPAANAGST